jgi:hypothetical protein
MRVMKYLYGTRNEYLTLSADDLRVVKWYVDTSFAVHPDFKSHTGAVMILGKGAMQSIARKTKNERARQYGRRIGRGRRRLHNDFVDKAILGGARIQRGKEHCLSRQYKCDIVGNKW